MGIFKLKRIIITCPRIQEEIYPVIGNYVGKAQNVSKSQIYEESFHILLQFSAQQTVELQICQYSPQKIIVNCPITQSLLDNGLMPIYKDDKWQVFIESKKVDSLKETNSIKCSPEIKNSWKKKSKSSQKNLKQNLQKQINLLMGKKPHKGNRKVEAWKKELEYFSLGSTVFKNIDSYQSGNATCLDYPNMEASMEYGFKDSLGRNHRTLITGLH